MEPRITRSDTVVKITTYRYLDPTRVILHDTGDDVGVIAVTPSLGADYLGNVAHTDRAELAAVLFADWRQAPRAAVSYLPHVIKAHALLARALDR